MQGRKSSKRPMEVTCIILAGGQSRRMGEDKAFIQVENVAMFDRVFSTCRRIFSEIIIVTNCPDRFSDYDAIVVTDIIEKAGPLGGLYTGLVFSRYEYAFCVACDMPLLNEMLIRYLVSLTPGYDAVVPQINGFDEPLHSVYSRKCIAPMAKCLGQGIRQICLFLKQVKVFSFNSEELRSIDPQLKSFTNINTRDDLRKLSEKLPEKHHLGKGNL